MTFNREFVKLVKEMYTVGSRVEVLHMNDPRPVEPGTKGTVRIVDDIGTVHCDFDNGRQMGLIVGEDSFYMIEEDEKDA